MAEPERWLLDDRAPAALRGLLEAGAGRAELPNAVHERVGARLAVLTASSTAALSTAAALSASGKGVGATAASVPWLFAGVKVTSIVMASLVSVVVGGAAILSLHSPQQVHAPAPATSAEAGRAANSASRQGLLAPGDPAVPLEALAVEALPPVKNPAEAPRGPKKADRSFVAKDMVPERDSLETEVSVLRAARTLLVADPAAALVQLRAHKSAFPKSQLGAERSLLEVRSLLALGERGAAERIATTVLESSSGAVYRAQIRRLLKKEPPHLKDVAPAATH